MNDLETAVVLMLKSAGMYVTREDLSARLGVAAGDLDGVVEDLRSRGYRIDEVPGQGLRLVDVPAVLDGCELRTALDTSLVGSEVFAFGRVASTNDIAFSLARTGSPEGTLVVAEEQTRGKGRLGRRWHSPPGLGLWFSLVLRPEVNAGESSGISLVVALAVAVVLRDAYGVDTRIKWPNDVVVGPRKICGILTEAEFHGDGVEFVVVGTGINVGQREGDFPPALRGRATSIAIESPPGADRVDVLRRVLRAVEERYALLRRGAGE